MTVSLMINIYLTVRIVYRLINLARSEDFHVRRDQKESFRSYMCRWMLVFNICFLIPFANTRGDDESNLQSSESQYSADSSMATQPPFRSTDDLSAPLTRNGSESSETGNSMTGINNSTLRNSSRSSRRTVSMQSSQSSQSVLGTVMRYHLIRHIIFMMMFIFVFAATLLDAVNRKISARETRGKEDIQATLNHRFTKQHPCATAFVAVFAVSGTGLLVGLAFLRKPNFFAKDLRLRQPNMMIIPEKGDTDDDSDQTTSKKHPMDEEDYYVNVLDEPDDSLHYQITNNDER